MAPTLNNGFRCTQNTRFPSPDVKLAAFNKTPIFAPIAKTVRKEKQLQGILLVVGAFAACSPAGYQSSEPDDAGHDVYMADMLGGDTLPNDVGQRDVSADIVPETEMDIATDGSEETTDIPENADGGDPTDACENACGGCDELEGEPGTVCGTCSSGSWVCDGPDAVRCDGDRGEDALNGCGGCAPLDEAPDTACGDCQHGRWTCLGGDRISCEGDWSNSCGGCSLLDKEPDDACGACGLGVVVCEGLEAVACEGEILCLEGAPCDLDEVCATGHCSNGRCTPVGHAYAPPGEFLQGPRDTEPPVRDVEQRHVTLTRGFFVQATEVTQLQWRDHADFNPSTHEACEHCPVETVTFEEVLVWLNARSVSDELEPCYRLRRCDGTPGVDFECSSATWSDLDCTGWRLPTEAEWEYSARAGTVGMTFLGDFGAWTCLHAEEEVNAIAWHCGNSDETTHRVADLLSSPWGVYDSHGNVSEMTFDWRHPITASPIVDPVALEPARLRAIRGSHYLFGVHQVAQRLGIGPSERLPFVGFRPVRTLFYNE